MDGLLKVEDWRWPHFKPSELACRCCGNLPDELDEVLLDNLEIYRVLVGKPLRINSGHRCRKHNLKVGGAAYSQHKRLAVDISLYGHDPLNLYKLALEVGFLGIGLGETFIHLDMRNEIDGYQPPKKLTIWFYNKKGKEKWMNLLAADSLV